jgi:ATPase subunit of ABC transporter with duplicated ATPase domains
MTLLTARALGVTLAAPLFSNLDFAIDRGDRIGLVAANSRGKSTLLRCLAGEAEPTAGDVTRARGLVVRHLAQELPPGLSPLPVRAVVAGGIDDPQHDWCVDLALDELALPPEMRDRPLGALSGGWQRLVLLARAWIAGPDLLLADEPTNHLDLTRIAALEDWLAGWPRDTALLVASHDRAFLDAVTTRTLFLRADGSRSFALPYSRARAALDEADEADRRRFDNDLRRAGQLRRQAAKLKNIGINSGSDLLVVKTRQLTERAERIEAAARPGWTAPPAGTIRLDGAAAAARALVRLDDAAIATPDGRPLYRTGRLWLAPGDRVILLGANGAGKSRLVEAVRAAAAGTSVPGVAVAPAAVLGYADQALAAIGSDTPLATVTGLGGTTEQTARGLLAGAGIAIDAQTRPSARLSGGQRARLMLLVLRLTRPSLYLLDEPTNHLDIDGQETLEQELARDEAAALIVSHDRAFVRATGTRFWVIEGRRLVEHDDPEAFFAAARPG